MYTELYTWEWSAISADTAYFYFNKSKRRKILVEWWHDEQKVGSYASLCDGYGNPLEDREFKLSEEEYAFYNDFCRKKIAEYVKEYKGLDL